MFVMAQFFPNNTSGLGAALLAQLVNPETYMDIPIWQVQRQKVPVVSALSLGNPSLRMISFMGSLYSPIMNSVMSPHTCLVPHLRHNLVSAKLDFYAPVSDIVSEELNLNKQGLPVEIGSGSMLTFNFASTDRHPSGSLGVSYPIFEISLTLIKTMSILRNSPLFQHTFLADVDLSTCYEPSDFNLTKSIMNDAELVDWNDSYELVSRYLCGADQVALSTVTKKLNDLIDSFFEISTELNTDPTITARSEDMDYNHKCFRIHRIVSNTTVEGLFKSYFSRLNDCIVSFGRLWFNRMSI